MRTVVIPTPRLASEAKYVPKIQRYLHSVEHPRVQRVLGDATEVGGFDGTRVDYVRVHSVARRADGSPIRRVSRDHVRRLLRHGRVLDRDALLLARALEALALGVDRVRLGTPKSLAQGRATEIQ